ncbi:auxin-responsive protein IAA31-like [Phragmites australis]|uniref:auxin-responsive protein IAA31-like n=1 Tax=Phragmites australis TaxID=29695 RepID=UPI002D786C72|nr:auxin-responsive protein IAA31-like [Phragmites australis]
MEAATAASYVADVDNLKATELRLGLPGTEEEPQKTVALPTPPSTPRGKKRDVSGPEEAAKKRDCETAPPAAKAQVVGWPPVRSYRKSCFQQASSTKSKPAAPEETATAAAAGLFVKVSMDGAPYLRKIDLKMYKGYRELREALEAMFLCFSGGADAPAVNPSDFAVTYEDKDGDLMLVGDVPFDMFISTCKRLRIMKGSEARGLGSVKNN